MKFVAAVALLSVFVSAGKLFIGGEDIDVDLLHDKNKVLEESKVKTDFAGSIVVRMS